MAYTNSDQIWSQIENDFEELFKKAVKEAATKAQKDIRKKADQFIKEYYEYDPFLYKDRQYSLYKLVEDYYNETKKSNGIEIEFGVKYNPSKILGKHRSNSWYHHTGTHWIPRNSGDFDFDSRNNGIPEATWITNKFLEGVHPSGKIGDDYGIVDRYGSPDKRMQDFFDNELGDIIDKYKSSLLLNYLRKYFKVVT